MPSQTTPEFSQPKNYEALAEKYGVKPNDYKQIRDEIKGFSFTVLTTDKLGLSKRLLDFYANDKKNSIPVAQKKMLAMLAQLTKASQSIPGFDVETIKTGEKFTFEGNTVKIEHPTGTFQETTDPSDATKSISTEIVEIFTLNLAGDRPHIIDEHRQALEGTKVATANEWIDRNILSGVALAGAGIKNWEKDRDKFTEAILAAPRNAQAETKMPTTELANELTTIQEMSKEEGGGKYSAKYNLAILDFLRKTRDNNQNMGMYWANVQAYLTGHQDLMKEREETKLEIPTTPLIATSEPFLKATPSPLLAPSELKPAPTETQAANFPEVVSGAGLDLETPTAVINDPALTPAEQAMNG
ncbi:TPA: hypothetical protein DGH83_04070, partial [Candidatus Peregrinibacteria bacterium]|nr:hypothetical protein [Candidatus Peregrinibacteria bacterium]